MNLFTVWTLLPSQTPPVISMSSLPATTVTKRSWGHFSTVSTSPKFSAKIKLWCEINNQQLQQTGHSGNQLVLRPGV